MEVPLVMGWCWQFWRGPFTLDSFVLRLITTRM